MSRRSRVRAFGSAGVLVIAGVVCALVVPGAVGEAVATGLIAIGLGGAVLLVFYEVGLSEDHERAREEARRRREQEGRRRTATRGRPPWWRRRP